MGKVTEWTVTTDEDDVTRELLLAAKEMRAVLEQILASDLEKRLATGLLIAAATVVAKAAEGDAK
jgi:hypothetical protein